MDAAEKLVKDIPNHKFSLLKAIHADQQVTEANTKMTYLRTIDSLDSDQYVRHATQDFGDFYDNRIYMKSTADSISPENQDCNKIEYILVLDVSSHTVSFSRNIDGYNDPGTHSKNKSDHDQSLKKSTHTLTLKLDPECTYVPFVEGTDSLHVVFY